MFLNILITFYKFTSGTTKNKTQSRTVFIITLFCMFFQLSGMIFALFQTTDIAYLTVILGFIFCVIFSFSLQILNKINNKLLRQIINRVLCKHPNFPKFLRTEIATQSENQTEQEFGVEIILFMLSCSSCVFYPYLYLIVKPGITFDHPDLQVVPFFYTFWKTDTFLKYIVKSFFEGMISLSTITSYWNYTFFMTYTIINLKTHVGEINILLRDLIDTKVKRFMEMAKFHNGNGEDDCFIFGNVNHTWKQKYEKSVNREFVKIIYHHQYIHR